MKLCHLPVGQQALAPNKLFYLSHTKGLDLDVYWDSELRGKNTVATAKKVIKANGVVCAALPQEQKYC